MQKVEIFIPYPDTPAMRKNWAKWYSLNSYWSGKHWSMRQRDADFWHELVTTQLYHQRIPKRMFTRPVQITFLWNDGLDIDNHAAMAKMIVDSIKGWLIQNDSKRYYRRCIHDFHDKPYILVRVEEC